MEIKPLNEYGGPPRTTGAPPKSGIAASWRSHSSGVWIWFAQRIAAAGTLIFLLLHLHAPSSRRIQFGMLAMLLIHVAAGVRVLLIEYGKIGARSQAVAFWALLGIGAVVLGAFYLGLF